MAGMICKDDRIFESSSWRYEKLKELSIHPIPEQIPSDSIQPTKAALLDTGNGDGNVEDGWRSILSSTF